MAKTLRQAFDRLMPNTLVNPLRPALLEAFMAGAAAHDQITTVAIRSNDPHHVAKVMDDMAAEIKNRHN